ncbi:hypothetical protein GCM10010885_12640 [Alicyclobacillus cellulosilyticus]|uniref:Polyhydroxyalkanoate synthesis regulator phasin n=1 Tax=Alicyclobacillus cellulosilyticus TaxID=1003997 RepID=A0A917K8I9_9BACL|nr:phasin family protein [Alicyclobacillus cellulosilyticus]GGJ04970.1 hypothetical protein GCM10010885_12640 [Alicyclobacillus cellulosilyticus]
MTGVEDLLKKAVDVGFGVISVSRRALESTVKQWVDDGVLPASAAKEFLNRLAERGEEEKQHLQRAVQEQVQKALDRLGVPTREELQRLEARIAQLEARLGLTADAAPGPEAGPGPKAEPVPDAGAPEAGRAGAGAAATDASG